MITSDSEDDDDGDDDDDDDDVIINATLKWEKQFTINNNALSTTSPTSPHF